MCSGRFCRFVYFLSIFSRLFLLLLFTPLHLWQFARSPMNFRCVNWRDPERFSTEKDDQTFRAALAIIESASRLRYELLKNRKTKLTQWLNECFEWRPRTYQSINKTIAIFRIINDWVESVGCIRTIRGKHLKHSANQSSNQSIKQSIEWTRPMGSQQINEICPIWW